jgi:hypothetical protein
LSRSFLTGSVIYFLLVSKNSSRHSSTHPTWHLFFSWSKRSYGFQGKRDSPPSVSLFVSLVYCAESTVRWFVVREKHCWMAADSADKFKRTGRVLGYWTVTWIPISHQSNQSTLSLWVLLAAMAPFRRSDMWATSGLFDPIVVNSLVISLD